VRKAKKPSAHSVKVRDSVAHRLGNAGASTKLSAARRRMNPVSSGPQVKRFGIGKGGGVRHSKTTGRFI
jgi:hypothetical protein